MTSRVGVIGHPVGHSISPHFQQAAFDAVGIDARYEAWDIEPDDLASFVEGLRAPGTMGANVTIPHKEAAAQLVDRVHQTARFVGAVNTIINTDGLLEGYNTDVSGFQKTLERAGFDPKGTHAVLWGAGGAARAVAWALVWRGVGAITIINRTGLRAGRFRHDLSSGSADVALRAFAATDAEVPEALAAADLVVQCTPVGLQGSGSEAEIPFPVEGLGLDTMVVDLIANPAETALVQAAKASGRRAIGGLPMLVLQGASSFELWTRSDPPVEVMFAAAEAAMAGEPG